MTYAADPGIMTVAEESTSFPQVSRPVDAGGLGFGYKWNMGWMNDTLDYVGKDPMHRKHHHHQMTFGLNYAFSENFMLPISHDEVVHGKGSMLDANARQSTGKSSRTCGPITGSCGGIPARSFCSWGRSLRRWPSGTMTARLTGLLWMIRATLGMQRLVRDLNTLYRGAPALYARDSEASGFQWIEGSDAATFGAGMGALGEDGAAPMVVIANFTPVERPAYRIGLPQAGKWREVLNTDAEIYGGGNRGNMGVVAATIGESHGQPASADVTLPPLGTVFLTLGD